MVGWAALTGTTAGTPSEPAGADACATNGEGRRSAGLPGVCRRDSHAGGGPRTDHLPVPVVGWTGLIGTTVGTPALRRARHGLRARRSHQRNRLATLSRALCMETDDEIMGAASEELSMSLTSHRMTCGSGGLVRFRRAFSHNACRSRILAGLELNSGVNSAGTAARQPQMSLSVNSAIFIRARNKPIFRGRLPCTGITIRSRRPVITKTW